MIIKEITLIDDLLANSNNYYPEAHPNIQRNVELGTPQNGRTLKDQKIIDELFDILKYWIR